MRHVGCGEVAVGDHHKVELLGVGPVAHQVMNRDIEQLGLVVKGDAAHRRAKADPGPYLGFVDAAFDVIKHDRARRVRGDLAAKMFLEAVVGKLQPLFGAIAPEVAVHRAVDRLAELVQARAPGVIPQAAPVVLFLETDDLRNLGPFLCGRLKGPELRQAGGSGTNHCDTLFHAQSQK